MFKIREANSEDLSAIIAINNTAKNSHLNELETEVDEIFLSAVMEETNAKVYIIEQAKDVIAFVIFHVDQVIKIDKLSIYHDFRKKGLDEHLYQKIERLAVRKGIKKLTVTITSEDMLDFFERKGWKGKNGFYQLNL